MRLIKNQIQDPKNEIKEAVFESVALGLLARAHMTTIDSAYYFEFMPLDRIGFPEAFQDFFYDFNKGDYWPDEEFREALEYFGAKKFKEVNSDLEYWTINVREEKTYVKIAAAVGEILAKKMLQKQGKSDFEGYSDFLR